MQPSWFLVLTIVVLATLLARAGDAHRLRRRQCRRCGGVGPADANFCGQCGIAFGGRKRRRRRLRVVAAGRS